MFLDSAGTTPVTATGQPVGKILDKSGRGNHATQATSTARPTLQQDASGFYYLSFDGVDDSLATASVDFTGTDKATVFAGMRKNSDAASGAVCELSSDFTANAGSFGMYAPTSPVGTLNFGWGSRGTATVLIAATGFAAPISRVLTGIGDISADIAALRVNGALAQSAVASDQGAGTYGNYPLFVGRRGGSTLPFNGRLYGLIVRGAATSDPQLSQAERFIGQRMGLSF
jgi:hypothetical protein